MRRLGLSPTSDKLEAALTNDWFQTVTERLNTYSGAATPAASSIPQNQWIVFYNTTSGVASLITNRGGAVVSTSLTPAASVVTETSHGQASAVGTSLNYARQDHTHGSPSSIVGLTGTKAQFNTAVSDGDILYVGDVTQYTDEMAQDAVGLMIDTTIEYVDATPLLRRAALTGAITAPAGSNATLLGSFTTAQLNTALSDNDVATGGGTATGTNTGNETTTTEGALINGATAKTTPVDADYIGLMDSAASNILKKLSWANVKATLKTYFDTLYASIAFDPGSITIATETGLVQASVLKLTGSEVATINGTGQLVIVGVY